MRTSKPSLWQVLSVSILALTLLVACDAKAPKPTSTRIPASPAPGATKAVTAAAMATPLAPAGATSAPTTAAIPALGTPAAAAATYKVGDVLSIGDLTLAVLGWSQATEVEGTSKANAGERFVVLDLALLNHGQQELRLNFYRFKLRDAGAQEYDALGGLTRFSHVLNPGEPERADLTFKVPEASRGFVLRYPLIEYGNDYAVVNLGAEGVSANLPAALRIPQTNIQKMGQVATWGDLQLAVVGWKLSPGTEKDKPAPGTKLVVVDIVLRNGGSQAVSFAPSGRLVLRDARLHMYPQDERFELGPGVPGFMRIQAGSGETVRFQMAFQVPEDSGGYVVRFYDRFGSDEMKAYLQLSAEPKTVQVPAALASAGDKVHPLGQVVHYDDLALAVLRWGSAEDPGKNQPGAGNKFVVVDLMVVNRGSSLRSFINMTLRDASLQEYPLAWDYSFGESRFLEFPRARDITPGERARGQVVFRVPEGSSGYVFAFEVRVGSGDNVYVALGPTPAAFDPPAELLTANPNTHRLGEVIRQGGAKWAVLGWFTSPGDENVQAAAGFQFLVVDLMLVNGGTAQTLYGAGGGPRVRDANGYRFEPSSRTHYGEGGGPGAFENGLDAGERVRANLVYQVLADSKDCVVIIDPKWVLGQDAGDAIVVDLGDQPVSVEPPAELLGP